METESNIHQNHHENITFDDPFWNLESSLEIIKAFSSTWQDDSFRGRDVPSSSSLRYRAPFPATSCDITSWNLPEDVRAKYEANGIKRTFRWQRECLALPRVIENHGNVVYSAPTSAGKTFVAEVLTVKTVLERKRRVLVVLPFVAVVQEKCQYFAALLGDCGVRVESFVGGRTPPGGFRSAHVAVCTIEKANSLINGLLEDGSLEELGAIVVDELHLLGDPHRGYILELLLTKIKYFVRKNPEVCIQIVGMSALLPNLKTLAEWLDADLYETDFRPIKLEECCLISDVIYDSKLRKIKEIEYDEALPNKNDAISNLCIETIAENCSVLIFSPTKNSCETTAQQISRTFEYLGYSDSALGECLRKTLKRDDIVRVLEQLKSCSVGLDSILESTISFGVAFHHAGLTLEERDIIESGFKDNTIRVLIATSTLSSGVNLPARRVIIKSPIFNGKALDVLTYKQMVGRAGRMGIDTRGESILIATEKDKQIVTELMCGRVDNIVSCLEHEDKLMRAILEVVCSGNASSKTDIELFLSCTLKHFNSEQIILTELTNKIMTKLADYELIRLQKDEDNVTCIATPLGKACLSSSMAPVDGLTLFLELQKARECFVLETDLHMIYLVTPYSVASQWYKLDWLHYLRLWENLPASMKRVGKLVGIQESFISRCIMKPNRVFEPQLERTYQIYKRFYTALALQDLINEVPLSYVAEKFNCSRGMLQSLQQSAATFSGMVTAFTHQLGWKNFEILVSQFHDRFYFGIQSELLDLMKLKSLNGLRARAIFQKGIETVTALANAEINIVENALNLAIPFQSEKTRNGEHKCEAEQRNALKNIWITGTKGISTKEAAKLLILEARNYIESEMGENNIKWNVPVVDDEDVDLKEECPEIHKPSNVSNTRVVQSDDEIVLFYASPSPADEKVLSKSNSESLIRSPDSGNITNDSFLEHSLLENSFSAMSLLKDSTGQHENFTSDLDIDQLKNLSSLENKSCNMNSRNSSLFENSLEVDTQLGAILDDKRVSSSNQNNTRKISQELLSIQNCFQQSFSSIESQRNSETVDSRSSSTNKRKFPESNMDVNHGNTSPFKMKRTVQPINTNARFELKSCNEIISVPYKVKNISPDLFTNDENINQQFKLIHCCDSVKVFQYFIERMKAIVKVSMYIDILKYSTENANGIGHKLNGIKENAMKCCDNGRFIKGLAFFCNTNEFYYVDLQTDAISTMYILKELKSIFEDQRRKLMLYDCKKIFLSLYKCCDILVDCRWEDFMVSDWLLSSDEDHRQCLMKEVDNVLHDSIEISSIFISCMKAWTLWRLLESMKAKLSLESPHLLKSFSIEMESLKVLSQCELNGLRTDKKMATSILNNIKSTMAKLEKGAFRLAGRKFNIYSANDVAKVIGIYNRRKVKTNKQVLQKINNPLAQIIIYWRKLNSILIKNIYPLLSKMSDDPKKEKIECSYKTDTVTGRIIMNEPNLQNTPRNFKLSIIQGVLTPTDHLQFSCRDIVIASPNCYLVSADYCQLEFRLLAHLCDDSALLEIINSGEDIFKCIISKWKKIGVEEVDEELRHKAKVMCYGIIYGMGVKSLAENLETTREEAEELLGMFNKMYPGIENLKKATFEDCRKRGFVETLYGRRRYLPRINCEIVSEKLQDERRAFNTKIQGTAADVLKTAMISIDKTVKLAFKNYSDIKLVLLMHDELLYEVPSNELNKFAKIFQSCMETSVKLSVPLPVKMKYGTTWGNMQPLIV